MILSALLCLYCTSVSATPCNKLKPAKGILMKDSGLCHCNLTAQNLSECSISITTGQLITARVSGKMSTVNLYIFVRKMFQINALKKNYALIL
jgi:hypothetical protein